ncbi:hypothetical protein LOY55_13875 [Pseudomonas sp. B21-040]|jgi:hypothetical protein|uniref:hypothetical protein n=1 Tax=Pseudomonas sp. B21-040 TaxID=2895486 RepID=UPI00215F4599|nr:hypothetical protein [Pseudomonas sp. B21-040]UVL43119.1 hypothetical protein LOY55_13875 [Pseudomonas sp. B21-040]
MDIKDAICAFSVLFFMIGCCGIGRDPRGYVTDHLWPRAAGIKGSYHLKADTYGQTVISAS